MLDALLGSGSRELIIKFQNFLLDIYIDVMKLITDRVISTHRQFFIGIVSG